MSLEETIRKIIQSEFDKFLPYIIQQVKKCEFVSAQELDEESIDDPIKIDFVQKKELSTSIASIKCKIRRLKIPVMALDSCSKIAIITENIVLRIKAIINRSIKHNFSDVATV